MLAQPIGAKRHQVDVYLPSQSVGRLGRRTGSDTAVLEGIPAEIEQLTGLELIRAHRVWAEATHRVRVTLYPGHGITSEHYLLFGTRRLHVGAVIDPTNTGVEIELLCREEV